MNAFAQNSSPNGTDQEPEALDKPAGEAAPPGEQVDRLALQLDRLGRLADMAMKLAEGLTRKAAEIEIQDGDGYEDVCLAFTRIARAIRQINFQEQEILGLRETRDREVRETRAKAEQEARDKAKAREKGIIRQTVRELMEAERKSGIAERDALSTKLSRDYDDYYDLYRGSFEEIIARICRDLGIAVAPQAGFMSDDPAALALGPADTPIGARQRIEDAAACLRRGTGPP
jgi:hypothetical protein